MPIRINLLAEAQAAEDLRRRDPAKRSAIVAVSLIVLALLWCLTVQARILRANSDLKKQEAHWKSIEKPHAEVTEDLKKSAAVERKLASLNRLSTNRFLLGSLLNTFQKTTVEEVQTVRLKTEQTFTAIDPVAAKATAGKATAGKAGQAKPAAAVEKIILALEARDWNPGGQNYNKFKEAIAKYPSFQTNLVKKDALRLTSLSKPMVDPNDPVKPFVTFTLEMQFPEIRRDE